MRSPLGRSSLFVAQAPPLPLWLEPSWRSHRSGQEEQQRGSCVCAQREARAQSCHADLKHQCGPQRGGASARMSGLDPDKLFGKDDPMKLYKLLEELAVGSYGRVYRVQEKRTNQICALKVIPLEDNDPLEVLTWVLLQFY